MASSFERLVAWRVSMALAKMVYRETAGWPRDERFGLTSQVRRAAYSIPLNIAEGSARHGAREFRRHTSIALGSLAEVECGVHLASELGFGAPSAELATHLRRTGFLVWRLHQSLPRD